MRTTILLSMLNVMLVACAVTKPNQNPWEPAVFRFAYMPSPFFLISGSSLEWNGICLVERIPHKQSTFGHWEHEVWETRKYHPTKAQWLAFWADVERIKVQKWRKGYSPSDRGEQVFDGGGWGFQARVGNTVIDTSGDNAGPDLPNISRTSVGGDAIKPLEEAINKLKQSN